MAAASVRQQIERLLDENPGRTMPVIVQAEETDRAAMATASAAARPWPSAGWRTAPPPPAS